MTTLLQRLLSYVDTTVGEDACWIWTGTINDSGYGVIGYGCRGEGNGRAHRIMWELANGSLESGECVLHRCDVRACINPKHLFVGTRVDNARDMREKQRDSPPPHHRGEANNKAKLTADQVRAIRREYREGLPPRRRGRRPFTEALARRYGIDRSQINNIVSGRQWCHVTDEQEGVVPHVSV